METMDDYKDELEASFRRINEGDIISGTVIDVNEEEVTLDLKYYAQGIIKVADLSNDPDFNVMEQVHKGDVIEATVVQTDDGAGNIVLSKKEANDILAWDKLKQMMEDETTVKVRIKESVPSGVVTYLEGIRAFIPASQITLDYVEDTDAWIGKRKTGFIRQGSGKRSRSRRAQPQDLHDRAGNCTRRNCRDTDAIRRIYQPWKRTERSGTHLTDL